MANMWECFDCGEIFDDPSESLIDLEYEYGVGGMFDDHHYANCNCCPCCGSTEIEECDEEEAEEDFDEDIEE